MYTYDDEAEKLASSDFGVDQGDQGGLGDSQRLIVLQDAELEHETADGLIEHINQATDDMVEVSETYTAVMESIRNQDKASMEASLVKARALRRRMSKRYGSQGSHLPVVESIHSRVVTVMALEEEAEEEVGFLRRIFRSIANAFRWLWEKLTGVFRSNEKKDEAVQDKVEKAAEQVKDLEASSEKNESKDLMVSVRGSDDSTMDWFGKDLSFQHITGMLEELDRTLRDATRGVEDLKDLGKFITASFAAVRNASEEDSAKIFIQFNEKVMSIVSRWPQQDKKLLKDSDIQGREVSKIHGFDQLPTGKGFLAVSYRGGGRSMWELSRTDGVFLNLDRSMTALMPDEMNKAIELVEKIRKSSAALNTAAITVSNLERDIDREIKSVLEHTQLGSDEAMQSVKTITRENVRPLLRVISAMAMFYASLPTEGFTAAGFMGNYVALSAVARKVKPGETSNEKKD